MKNSLKWFCSILLLSVFPFPPQGSAFPVIHALFKSVNHLPSFTDALRTCLIGQISGISGKLAFNLPNPEPFAGFYEQDLEQGSGNISLGQDQGEVSLFSELPEEWTGRGQGRLGVRWGPAFTQGCVIFPF